MKCPNGFGLGRPNSSARNSADSRLSRDATMVWLKLMLIVLFFLAASVRVCTVPRRKRCHSAHPRAMTGSLFRRRALKGDVVRVAELQDVCRANVFHRVVLHTDLVEMRCGTVQFGPTAEPERDVIEAAAILVEAVPGDRPQPEQRAAEVVDDTAVQEAQLVAGRLVGVVRDLQQYRPPEHALVELP